MKFFLLFLLVSCAQVGTREPSSERSDFAAWNFWPLDEQGCMNPKDQFLQKNSSGKVTFNKKFNLECNVIKGHWRDFYTGEDILQAADAIVTPVVPLAHLNQKGISQMPMVRVLGMNSDMNYFIVVKKGSEGEKKHLANADGPEVVPNDQPGVCEFWGMWKEMKEKWNISFKNKEKKLINAQVEACQTPKAYSREAFKHWSTLLGRKCDTRNEVLTKTSMAAVVNVQEGDSCSKVTAGSWYDLYTADMISDAKLIDIDHFVPLMNAYISGGWKWPQWKKELYANFQEDNFHLVSVSAKQNRSKGAAHPGNYMPPLESYKCDYMKQWIAIKFRWSMNMSLNEATAIDVMMIKCGTEDQAKASKIIKLLQSKDQAETEHGFKAE